MAEFIIPASLSDAVSFKNSKSAYIAGGTEINRLASTVNAERLIDIRRLSFGKVSFIPDLRDSNGNINENNHVKSADNAFIRLGSTLTFQEAIENPYVPEYFKDACRNMANRTKRNMATIGGNAALLRDDSYIYANLLASRAKLELLTQQREKIWVCCKTYLYEHEKYKDCLILAILLHNDGTNVFSKRIANTAQSHSCLNVAVGKIPAVGLRIAASVKGTGIILLDDLASVAQGKDDYFFKSYFKNSGIKFVSDMYGSAEYKIYLLATVVSDLVRIATGGSV